VAHVCSRRVVQTVPASKHKKTPSLPDSAILLGADVGGNVSRSLSDSRRKMEAGAAMHLTPISIGDSDGSAVTLRDRSQVCVGTNVIVLLVCVEKQATRDILIVTLGI
jgi:hypothetical protein